MVSCAAAAAAAAEMEAASQGAEGGSLAMVASVAAAAGGRGGSGVAGVGREPEGLPCPRCESVNTKFCYYNNYNLSQPRYFCRSCRRYWTRGGALRNVPVGGGTRKATPSIRRRRPASSGGQTPASSPAPLAVVPGSSSHAALLRQYAGGLAFPHAPASMASPLAAVDPDRRLLDLGGSFSFSSLIAAAGPAPDVGAAHFSAGFLAGGLAPGLAHAHAAAAALPLPPPPQQQQQPVSQAMPEGLMWSMGWPDLSI